MVPMWVKYSVNARLKHTVRMASPISRVSPPLFPVQGSIQLRMKCMHPYDRREGASRPKSIPWVRHWSPALVRTLVSFSPYVPHLGLAPTLWPLMFLIHTTSAPTSGPLLRLCPLSGTPLPQSSHSLFQSLLPHCLLRKAFVNHPIPNIT